MLPDHVERKRSAMAGEYSNVLTRSSANATNFMSDARTMSEVGDWFPLLSTALTAIYVTGEMGTVTTVLVAETTVPAHVPSGKRGESKVDTI